MAAIRDHADRRLQEECDEIADSMRNVLDRESGPDLELKERAMVPRVPEVASGRVFRCGQPGRCS